MLPGLPNDTDTAMFLPESKQESCDAFDPCRWPDR